MTLVVSRNRLILKLSTDNECNPKVLEFFQHFELEVHSRPRALLISLLTARLPEKPRMEIQVDALQMSIPYLPILSCGRVGSHPLL
jgi:hypothetical protein